MKKIILMLNCFILLFLLSSKSTVEGTELKQTFTAENLETNLVPFRVWPGRPGGNGDGSEEWLVGNYGEENGPYRYIGSSSGNVSDLNSSRNYVASVVSAILSYGRGIFITTAILIAGMIAPENFAGTVYTAESYVSGRSMKTIITTYYLPNYTHYCAQYTIYNKW